MMHKSDDTCDLHADISNMILGDFIQTRTTFVVTHRQSSLSLVERVVVMDSGRIVHDGSVKDVRETSDDFNFLFAKSA